MVKTTDFRREERTRRGPPEAVPQAPYGVTERERRCQNDGLSDGMIRRDPGLPEAAQGPGERMAAVPARG